MTATKDEKKLSESERGNEMKQGGRFEKVSDASVVSDLFRCTRRSGEGRNGFNSERHRDVLHRTV